jgi:multicomponent Na+:H+ antiporter subunit B
LSARLRFALFAAAAVVVAVAWVKAAAGLPHFGVGQQAYGDRAVAAATSHATANAVASVSFDVRGFDTLGEEFVLVMAVLGGTLLLRRASDESEDHPQEGQESPQAPRDPPTSEVVRLIGYLTLPVSVVIAVYLVAHGGVSPGGGFQGGAVLATGIHLLYLAGDYPALDRLRSVALFEWTEAVGAAGYAAIGFIGLSAGAAYLANTLPKGTIGALTSAGTVPLLQVATGIAVTSGIVVLLSEFLEQTLVVRPDQGEA